LGRRVLSGKHAVREALSSTRVPLHALYVLEGEAPGELIELARKKGVAAERRDRTALESLAGSDRHQGIVVVVGEYPYLEPEDLVARAQESGEPPLLLALDGIQDPQNLGAIVRSVSFFGAHGVLLPRNRAAHVSGAVVRASAGATERTGIALCTNLVRTLEDLKREGMWIVGTTVEGGKAPSRIDLGDPVVICIGSEEKGLRPLVTRSCDHLASIPGSGGVASLNAAAAATALLYEARRQRGES